MTQEWTQALTVWHKAASMGPKPKDPEAEKRKRSESSATAPETRPRSKKKKQSAIANRAAYIQATSLFRPIIECVKALYGDPEFAEESVFRPERHYANADKPDCMMICTPPNGGGERRKWLKTVEPALQLSQSSSRPTKHRPLCSATRRFYPVYMTIASHVCQLLITVAWIMADLADIGFLDTHPNGALTAAHWQEGRDLFIPVQTVANEPWHSMPSFAANHHWPFLPPSNQKNSKVSLLDGATSHISVLTSENRDLQDRIIALEEQSMDSRRGAKAWMSLPT
ncbi:hypothetical protein B0H14DRAFT_2578605 [Mycena olivaceomarginata]|nr:hypothetical protein B0H14DRAFT_2578605 [Mycena olivaceomarginata]